MSDDTVTAPAPTRGGLSLSARDLLNVAIFAVIYFVVVFAVAMLGIAGPVAMLVTLPLGVVVAGVPYMLFLTRVRHAGMVALFGTVVALLYLLSGQPWISTVVTIVLSVIAEFVLAAGRYRSRSAAIWTHTVFALWFIGPWIPLFVDREAYLNSPGLQVMGPDYVAAFDRVVSPMSLTITCLACAVCGLLGGLFGSYLLRKHFTRAGLA